MRINPSPIFAWPVEFTVPGEPNAVVEFKFRHKNVEQLKLWRAQREKPLFDALAEVVDGWADGHVVTESGVSVPFSPESLRQFLEAHATRGPELVRGYLKAVAESRVKN